MRVSQPFVTAPVKARRRRRSFPIHAYIGANGGGKSLAAVYDSLPTLAAGRPVLSTVRILDPKTGLPHPLWIKLDGYAPLLEAESCDVILDEVTGVASSRDSAGMPAVVANRLVQLRRRDIALRWTAPNWKRADTIIRECSQGVTLCMGFAPEVVKAEPTEHDGPHDPIAGPLLYGGEERPTDMYWCQIEGHHVHETDRQWSSKRLFYWRTYDAAAFDEWTAYRKEKVRPSARQIFWRPGSIAEAAYLRRCPLARRGHRRGALHGMRRQPAPAQVRVSSGPASTSYAAHPDRGHPRDGRHPIGGRRTRPDALRRSRALPRPRLADWSRGLVRSARAALGRAFDAGHGAGSSVFPTNKAKPATSSTT
jgi:hypothetical protein